MATESAKITTITYAWGELRWLITPFLLSLKRHWPQITHKDLILITDVQVETPYEINNITRPDIVNNWSGIIQSIAKELSSDLIYLINIDFFLIEKVDHKKIEILSQYVASQPDILQGYLFDNIFTDQGTFDLMFEFVEEWHGLEIGTCKDWHSCSIWNGGIVMPLFKRNLMISLFKPGLSIQDAERQLIIDVRNNGYYGVTTNPPPVKAVELHTSSFQNYWHFEYLDKQDQELIERYKPDGTL